MSTRWAIVVFGVLLLAILIDIAATNADFTYAYITGQCSKTPLPTACTESTFFGVPKPKPPAKATTPATQ